MSTSLDLTQEFTVNANNGEVGNALVSETDRARIRRIYCSEDSIQFASTNSRL